MKETGVFNSRKTYERNNLKLHTAVKSLLDLTFKLRLEGQVPNSIQKRDVVFQAEKTAYGKPRSGKVHSRSQKAILAEATRATMDRGILKTKQNKVKSYRLCPGEEFELYLKNDGKSLKVLSKEMVRSDLCF